MKETKITPDSCHADPDHRVAADRVGAKHGSGLHGWHRPGSHMEICGVVFNHLMTLLEFRCQEPHQQRYQPPDGCGHPEELENSEDD